MNNISFDKNLNPIIEHKVVTYVKSITKHILQKTITFFNIDIDLSKIQKVEVEPLIKADNTTIYNEVAIISKWINSCNNNRQLNVCRDIVDKFKIKYQHSSAEYLRILIHTKQNEVTAY